MSDDLHLSFIDKNGGNGEWELCIGPSRMRITELRVRDASNWATPHEVLGKGGSSMLLTDQQLVKFLAEWIRMTVNCSDVDYSNTCVKWSFSCQKINEPIKHDSIMEPVTPFDED